MFGEVQTEVFCLKNIGKSHETQSYWVNETGL